MNPNETLEELLFESSAQTAIQIYQELEQILQITQENNEEATKTIRLNFGGFKLAREPKTSFFNLTVNNANYRLFPEGRIQLILATANSAFFEGIDLLTHNQSAYILLASELAKAIAENRKEIEEQTQYTNTSIREALN